VPKAFPDQLFGAFQRLCVVIHIRMNSEMGGRVALAALQIISLLSPLCRWRPLVSRSDRSDEETRSVRSENRDREVSTSGGAAPFSRASGTASALSAHACRASSPYCSQTEADPVPPMKHECHRSVALPALSRM